VLCIYKCCSNNRERKSITNSISSTEKLHKLGIPQVNISDKNLANTEAQTVPRILNEDDMIFESDDDLNEEVPEFIISQLKEIKDKSPKLQLIVKESLYLPENLIIKIDALGLTEKSLRNKKDGYTFFGLLSPNDEENSKSIDFSTGSNNINQKDNNNDNKNENNNNTPVLYGRQFCIRFDIKELCYFIKDCSNGNGYGTFMKVFKETKIKDNTLINIGENYVVFTLGVDILESDQNNDDAYLSNDERILSVKVFRGELTNYSYAFNPSQISKILIGKDESCNIVLNDNLLDNIHCCIEYKQYIGWVLNDGYNQIHSESGTWICLSEETKIFEGMIIQSNQSIYECHINK
jgi:hypothetical protein